MDLLHLWDFLEKGHSEVLECERARERESTRARQMCVSQSCQTNICYFQATLKKIEHKYKCDFTKNESLKMSPRIRLWTTGLRIAYLPVMTHTYFTHLSPNIIVHQKFSSCQNNRSEYKQAAQGALAQWTVLHVQWPRSAQHIWKAKKKEKKLICCNLNCLHSFTLLFWSALVLSGICHFLLCCSLVGNCMSLLTIFWTSKHNCHILEVLAGNLIPTKNQSLHAIYKLLTTELINTTNRFYFEL